MDPYPAIQPSYAERLIALAQECLREPASRLLDAEIYCAVHGMSDLNYSQTQICWKPGKTGKSYCWISTARRLALSPRRRLRGC
jgi:hypothetical protein